MLNRDWKYTEKGTLMDWKGQKWLKIDWKWNQNTLKWIKTAQNEQKCIEKLLKMDQKETKNWKYWNGKLKRTENHLKIDKKLSDFDSLVFQFL